jgi:hypothetical protein
LNRAECNEAWLRWPLEGLGKEGGKKDHTAKPLHGQADIDSYIREAKALLATLTDEERGRWKVTWTGTEGT